jgi:hypothetical protein
MYVCKVHIRQGLFRSHRTFGFRCDFSATWFGKQWPVLKLILSCELGRVGFIYEQVENCKVLIIDIDLITGKL